MKTKFQKGFTLIELLVVIGLIAILAAIAIMVINPGQLQAKAKDGVIKGELAKIGMAASGLAATDDALLYPKCVDLIGSLKGAVVVSNCAAALTASNSQRFSMPIGSLGVVTLNYSNTAAAGTTSTVNSCIAAQEYADTTSYWRWCSTTGAITEVAGTLSATVGCAAGC